MLCSKVFSPMFKHRRCYAIWFVFNFLTSLMLRYQIFLSVFLTFYHHGWYAIRTFLQLSNLHYCCALRSSLQFSNITDATLWDPTNLQAFSHHWCYAPRSSLQNSNILPSLMLPSKFFSSIFQHQLMLQFKIFSWKHAEHSRCTLDISRLIPKSNSAGTTKLTSSW